MTNLSASSTSVAHSVTEVHQSIRHHTPIEWGPEVREWGMRELGLRDPNGYFITFAESVNR